MGCFFLFLCIGVFFEQVGTLLSVLVFTAFYVGLVQISSSSMLNCKVEKKIDAL